MPRYFTLASLHETLLFGSAFALGLRPGDVVTFSGEIGAGKTTMIRAMTRVLTGGDEASSPSFTLWQQYRGETCVNHLDLYRIESERDLPELGLFDALAGDCVTLIEWPERAQSFIPEGAVHLTLRGAGNDVRELEIA